MIAFGSLEKGILLIICIALFGCRGTGKNLLPLRNGTPAIYRIEGEILGEQGGSTTKLQGVKVKIACSEGWLLKLSKPHEATSDNEGYFRLEGYGAPWDYCELVFDHPDFVRTFTKLAFLRREEPSDTIDVWHWRVQVTLKKLSIYDSDEIAMHYYDSTTKTRPSRNVVGIWATIVPKDGNNNLLKRLYVREGYGSCEGIDFSTVRKIECRIEIDCSNSSYRVLGGLFEEKESITICEPPDELILWSDIPSASAIEKLSKSLCP